MPRNSAGTMSLPAGQPVVSGTNISSAVHNALAGDVAQELTSSLDRSGRGGMLAPIRTPDGTAGAPAHSFTNETNSGLYRAGAGDVRVATGGSDRVKITAAGLAAAAFGALSAASAIVRGAVADGAAAIGVVLDNNVSLANATARVLSVQNYGVEALGVDKDGQLTLTGTRAAAANVGSTKAQLTHKNSARAWANLTLGGAGAVTVVDGYNVASAAWATTDLTITLANALPDANVGVVATHRTQSGSILQAQVTGTTTILLRKVTSAGAIENWAATHGVYLAVLG